MSALGLGFRLRLTSVGFRVLGVMIKRLVKKVVIGVLTNANEVILTWVLVEKLYLSYHNRDL